MTGQTPQPAGGPLGAVPEEYREELAALLPSPRADSRVVQYVTDASKRFYVTMLDGLSARFPRVPKNVIHQICFVVQALHWSEVEELVGRWDRGERLTLASHTTTQGNTAAGGVHQSPAEGGEPEQVIQ